MGTNPTWHVTWSISDPGASNNEDSLGAAGAVAWVLDGAGLGSSPRFKGFKTDAAWLVTEATGWLTLNAHRELTITDVLAGLERHLSDAFGAPDPTDPAGGPSACLSLAQLTPDGRHVDIATIADTVALIPRSDGGLEQITDTRVVPFEEKTFAAMRGLPRINWQLPEAARDQLRINRDHLNRPNGYAAICPTRPWTHLVKHQRVAIDPSQPIVLLSDGASRLFDTFGVLTAADCHALAAGDGPALLAKLRSIEQNDPKAEHYTRFKIHDDATFLVAQARMNR